MLSAVICRTGFEEDKDFPVVINAVVAGRYHVTEYLGSAAFSKAIQAHDLHTGMDVCMKIIKNNKDFFDQSLDEIKLLKYINKHDPGDKHHLLRLYDYFYHRVMTMTFVQDVHYKCIILDVAGYSRFCFVFTLIQVESISSSCFPACVECVIFLLSMIACGRSGGYWAFIDAGLCCRFTNATALMTCRSICSSCVSYFEPTCTSFINTIENQVARSTLQCPAFRYFPSP
jgi:hypothetical protein